MTSHPKNIENKLKQQLEICHIHADRIQIALKHIEPLLPLTNEKIACFTDEQLGLLELLTSRIGKLQDTMGAQLFPLTLTLIGEQNERHSMIDKLNLLEKLRFIDRASFWQDLRNLRNEITHEYENEIEKQKSKIELAIQAAHELLNVFKSFIQTAQQKEPLSKLFSTD